MRPTAQERLSSFENGQYLAMDQLSEPARIRVATGGFPNIMGFGSKPKITVKSNKPNKPPLSPLL